MCSNASNSLQLRRRPFQPSPSSNCDEARYSKNTAKIFGSITEFSIPRLSCQHAGTRSASVTSLPRENVYFKSVSKRILNACQFRLFFDIISSPHKNSSSSRELLLSLAEPENCFIVPANVSVQDELAKSKMFLR